MNSPPRREDGEARVATNGSRSSLEQTVMGVAPPPPNVGSAPAHGPAVETPRVEPSAVQSANTPDTVSTGTTGPAPMPDSTIVVPQAVVPQTIVPTSTLVAGSNAPASRPDRVADLGEARPGEGAAAPISTTIVAAPVIALSTAPASPLHALTSSTGSPAAELPAPAAGAGETLRIEAKALAPSERDALPVTDLQRSEPAPEGPSAPHPREQTALSADYLRDARAVALQQASQTTPSHDPIGLASTERAPLADVAAAMAHASANVGDTHRSVAPPLEPGPASTRTGLSAGNASPRGFEPVPVVRAPLAESLSSALGPLAELGGPRHSLPSSRPYPPPLPPLPQRESGVGRWLLLAAVALATVGIVSLGGRLWHRYRAHTTRESAVASVRASPPRADGSSATAASHALLANRPALEPIDEGRVRVMSASAAAPAASTPSSSASPESQLAATAGRHVLSGNHAEALPLYRQLERNWPENTSYAAMVRLLEKKVGSRNDTRTIAPATPPAVSVP